MNVRLTGDGNYLLIEPEDIQEKEQVTFYFRKQDRDHFIKKKKLGWKAGNGWKYFITNDFRISIGLWKELVDMCREFRFPLRFDHNTIFNHRAKKQDAEELCEYLLAKTDYEIREEQLDCVAKASYYRYCLLDMSVSAGKTLLAYMLCCNLKRLHGNYRILILTIKPSLSIMFWKEFTEFNTSNYLRSAIMHGEYKEKSLDKADVVISNWQFLGNRLEQKEFFAQFDAVIVDEAHKVTGPTIQQIIGSCVRARYRVGLTGSIRTEKNNTDYYNLLQFFGPIVASMSKRQAINAGRAADGKVKVFKLDYLPMNMRQTLYNMRFNGDGKEEFDGERILRLEEEMVRSSKVRIRWIASLIAKFEGKNILVFFNDVKGGYGRRILDEVKRVSGKTTFYIDKDVPQANREYFKQQMEKGTDIVLGASYGCWSTGESVKNLHVVLCAEAIKDEILLSQSMGRPMRLHDSKDDGFLWIDLVDDFSMQIETPSKTFLHKNYMLKWADVRRKYYTKEEFPQESHKISIGNFPENF